MSAMLTSDVVVIVAFFILIHPHGHPHSSLVISSLCLLPSLPFAFYESFLYEHFIGCLLVQKVVQGLRVNCDEAGGRSEPKAKPLCASHCEPSHAIIIIIIVSVLVIIVIIMKIIHHGYPANPLCNTLPSSGNGIIVAYLRRP